MGSEKRVIFCHHKCGTTWLRNFAELYEKKRDEKVFITGKNINPTEAEPYDLLILTNSSYKYAVRHRHRKALHIIRNPLDVIVSAYYSHKNIHPLDGWPELEAQRKLLRGTSKEVGMLLTWLFLERPYTFQKNIPGPLIAMRNWNYDNDNVITLRAEEIFYNTSYMTFVLDEFFNLSTRPITKNLTFEQITGRALGEIDNNSHFRCGMEGQWKSELPYSIAFPAYLYYQNIIERFYGHVSIYFD